MKFDFLSTVPLRDDVKKNPRLLYGIRRAAKNSSFQWRAIKTEGEGVKNHRPLREKNLTWRKKVLTAIKLEGEVGGVKAIVLGFPSIFCLSVRLTAFSPKLQHLIRYKFCYK